MPLDENGRRKSLRNLMGLEPNLPGTIGADDGLQEGASPAPFRPMHGSAPFMTKPSYKIVRQSQRQRQPSFRTQMKNEEVRAGGALERSDSGMPPIINVTKLLVRRFAPLPAGRSPEHVCRA